MKFQDYHYQRPDIAELKANLGGAIEAFRAAKTFDDCADLMDKVYNLRNDFETMRQIASIRNSIDTLNEQYEEEQNFFDRESPVYDGLISDFYKALVASPFKEALKEKFGQQLFSIAELTIKTFKPEIVEDLQRENELSSAYKKLKASAAIDFEGEERTLTGMQAFVRHHDRDMRQRASKAYWGFMEGNSEKFDEIFHELTQVRTRIAKKLGYENYVQLGYDRMLRTDYNAEMVAGFRQQVLEQIVPLATKLRKAQAERIGLTDLKHYDEELLFRSGNPNPKGDSQWIIDRGRDMYDDLSDETGEFYRFMMENGLLDLETKKGKAGGGFCTYMSNHKAPFIFSNFNGTAMDIFVLTHEAGHAFQVYMSRGYEVSEYNWPTYEACEIHSMSMEFFTWPWMDKFFEGDADKFRFMHVLKALLFLPYGVAVDEFQHHVYENPTETPAERNAAWRAIEKKYLPHRDYDGKQYLENGGFWQVQSHIFESPFYYIDYTLAQICAFQFWKKSLINKDEAFKDYVRLCKAGGSKPFLELVDYANLTSPFEDGSIGSVIRDIEDWLDKVDEVALETA